MGTPANRSLDHSVGIDARGAPRIGNCGHAIHVGNGGATLIQGNVLTANGSAGVRVELDDGGSMRASRNRITPNAILRNTGTNAPQNAPKLTLALPGTSDLAVLGSLHSTALATCDIECFGCRTFDVEGEVLFMTFTDTTDALGDAAFLVTDPNWPLGLPVAATATDPLGDPSECGWTYVRTPVGRRSGVPSTPPPSEKPWSLNGWRRRARAGIAGACARARHRSRLHRASDRRLTARIPTPEALPLLPTSTRHPSSRTRFGPPAGARETLRAGRASSRLLPIARRQRLWCRPGHRRD